MQMQDLTFRLGRLVLVLGGGQSSVLALELSQDKPCLFARTLYVCARTCVRTSEQL